MKIGIVIQARMGSSRLPGKVLSFINGITLLDHILNRLRRYNFPFNAPIIIATTNRTKDNIISEWCNYRKVKCFRGDENNVLNRYYECAKSYKIENIIRLTADNPLPDIDELLNLINFHLANNYDYSNSFNQMPLGVGAEIFSLETLKISNQFSRSDFHREHVNEYIFENKNKFNIGYLHVEDDKLAPNFSLTIDTDDDLKLMKKIANISGSLELLTTKEAIELCIQFA